MSVLKLLSLAGLLEPQSGAHKSKRSRAKPVRDVGREQRGHSMSWFRSRSF